jgi:kinetochor protein Mis14/NSL1
VEEAKKAKVDVGTVERVDEMRSSWRKGQEGLEELKMGLGGSVAGLEKAQRAVEVVGERR